MSVYLDPSVIVSLFIADSSSLTADRFLRTSKSDISISDFAAAEFASALSLRVRTRDQTAAHARTVLAEFDEWAARSTNRVNMTAEDVAVANGYLRRLDAALRTPDALHLAIVQRIGGQLVTFDRKMSLAARALGVKAVAV